MSLSEENLKNMITFLWKKKSNNTTIKQKQNYFCRSIYMYIICTKTELVIVVTFIEGYGIGSDGDLSFTGEIQIKSIV